jgi:cytochrome c oxidase subunit II
MHLHRYEKIWLWIGGGVLVLFLAIVGVRAFAMGGHPPGGMDVVDPTKVTQTPPFNQPGLTQIGPKEYKLVMVARMFSFQPGQLEIPAGSTVHLEVTSPDVVHGLEIAGTNVNMMVVPGHVNSKTYKFDRPGEYLVVCNEYCGVGHQVMSTRIIVK